jgi:C4-type Zn-finger protein
MARNSAKDQAMAADLKKRNVKRTTLRCPICHAEISVKNAYVHIAFHPA